jgi:hypothetical protein
MNSSFDSIIATATLICQEQYSRRSIVAVEEISIVNITLHASEWQCRTRTFHEYISVLCTLQIYVDEEIHRTSLSTEWDHHFYDFFVIQYHSTRGRTDIISVERYTRLFLTFCFISIRSHIIQLQSCFNAHFDDTMRSFVAMQCDVHHGDVVAMEGTARNGITAQMVASHRLIQYSARLRDCQWCEAIERVQTTEVEYHSALFVLLQAQAELEERASRMLLCIEEESNYVRLLTIVTQVTEGAKRRQRAYADIDERVREMNAQQSILRKRIEKEEADSRRGTFRDMKKRCEGRPFSDDEDKNPTTSDAILHFAASSTVLPSSPCCMLFNNSPQEATCDLYHSMTNHYLTAPRRRTVCDRLPCSHTTPAWQSDQNPYVCVDTRRHTLFTDGITSPAMSSRLHSASSLHRVNRLRSDSIEDHQFMMSPDLHSTPRSNNTIRRLHAKHMRTVLALRKFSMLSDVEHAHTVMPLNEFDH